MCLNDYGLTSMFQNRKSTVLNKKTKKAFLLLDEVSVDLICSSVWSTKSVDVVVVFKVKVEFGKSNDVVFNIGIEP